MDTNDKKKAKLTPEQIEESARLRSLYDAARASGALKKTQAQIASDLKIGNQSMVGHLLGGRAALTLRSAVLFAGLLKCDVEKFSPRLCILTKP